MTDQVPLPDTFNLPSKLVAHWMSLPAETEIRALTKAEIDDLFFAVDHTLAAIANLQSSLVAYSNNDLAVANSASWESSRRLIEAQNKLRQFLTGIMSGAVAP